jgi:hypothetical protein
MGAVVWCKLHPRNGIYAGGPDDIYTVVAQVLKVRAMRNGQFFLGKCSNCNQKADRKQKTFHRFRFWSDKSKKTFSYTEPDNGFSLSHHKKSQMKQCSSGLMLC